MPIWTNAVTNAIRRHVAKTGSPQFTREAFFAAELAAIEAETGTLGVTPKQTATRVLQELRDAGLLEFRGRGAYRWLQSSLELEPATPTKGVFVLPERPDLGELPGQTYIVRPERMQTAIRTIGNWVVYQERRPGGDGPYVAAALVESVEANPAVPGGGLATIAAATYVDFGRVVSFRQHGVVMERGLLDPDGRLNRNRVDQTVRAITDAEYERILDLGLVTDGSLLPRTDDENEDIEESRTFFAEEQSGWTGPVERPMALVTRKVRKQQFRQRVLEAYGYTCALSGMNFRNGGSRPEVQAAHVMSVEFGGPDDVNNGIALSGTLHWMFDRGLLALKDDGQILVSRTINDHYGIHRLLPADRRARLPKSAHERPHPHYLEWHRTVRFKN